MGFKIENKIYKRKDGRWCVAYFDTGENPKRHYIYGKTKGEVKAKLAKFEGAVTEAVSTDISTKIQKKEVAENNICKDMVQKTLEEPEVKSVKELADKQPEHCANDLSESVIAAGKKWT